MILIVVYFPRRLTFVTIKFSELCGVQVWVRSRDGLDLDWIRTVANFVEFGLDPECKALQNLGSGQDLD